MAIYESTIIIRQDVSSNEIDKIAADLQNIITENGGSIIKTEYWGLRNLAYEIKNNKKGHYYFMGIEAGKPALDLLERKIKLSESIIRSALIKVDEITQEPSPILKARTPDTQSSIDVTSDKNNIIH
ncbi:MAG: 30S ribosomal protein S6 [Rickettsiaceae bacterium]|nr:30S ribosomal protein S6 [Rickettsiaceae bacterium]